MLLLLGLAGTAPAAELEVLPKFCLLVDEERCNITLYINWQADKLVCLRNDNQQTILHCATSYQRFPVKLNSAESIHFSLIEQDNEQVITTKKFNVLHNQSATLQQRRLSWSVF